MILVDSRIGSVELLPYIQRIGVPVDKTQLEYGDVCFEGNVKEGRALIGVERKTLHDMLHCIDDSRYAAHQRPGMALMYRKSFLIVEGCFKPHDPNGLLMEGFQGGAKWGFCRYRSQNVLYSKLRRYLFSISLSGVHVMFTRDIWQTAYDCCELYQWFQKKWTDHTAVMETQTLLLPDMGRPTLVRRWAANLTDVGVKFSIEAQRLFKTPINLAVSDESEWMKIKGIGVHTAQSIIREIHGWTKH